MILKELYELGVVQTSPCVVETCGFLAVGGSVSYGVAEPDSDKDCTGWCFPPVEMVFPERAGYIRDFGTQPPAFKTFQSHAVIDPRDRQEYDFKIYSVVRFANLFLKNAPDMIEMSFVKQENVLHENVYARWFRDNRNLFIHQAAVDSFMGFSHSSLKKGDNKNMYHALRLALECEELVFDGVITLDKNREILKEVRAGKFSLEEITKMISSIRSNVDGNKTNLPSTPKEKEIKEFLWEMLNMHYGI